MAAAAAFMERATALTLDPARRARRALGAAQAKAGAGAFDTSLALLVTAEAGPLDEFQRAQIHLLRGQITFFSSRGVDAPPLLLMAAKEFERFDPALARDTYLDALMAAAFAGRLAGGGLVEVANAVRAAPPPPQPPRATDVLLDGLALVITESYASGAPSVRRAVDDFCRKELVVEDGLRWPWLAAASAAVLWDFDAWDAISARIVELARDAGGLAALILVLILRSLLHVLAGELAMAASLVEQAAGVAEATGGRAAPYGALALAPWRGREAEARRLIDGSTEHFRAGGEGMGLTLAEWATAVLYNGLARYAEAQAAAQRASDDPNGLMVSAWALPELVEAAVRTGDRGRGAEALRRLTEMTRACGTEWALGIEARSRALLSEGEAADRLYREAIDRLARTRVRVELARAHLLYGEWLRRERRRLEAREQLRRAHELFQGFGAEAFAERARIELEATGERARKRTPDTRDELTPQEVQISRLAAEGQTNQEIAAQLFISASTVDYHLRKVFRKLGVKSRTQLAHHMQASAALTARAA
jgi:DNA-binding CsgD family transcriptional regulator